MKKIKIFWKSYQNSGVESWTSPNGSWKNCTNTEEDSDHDIYIDSLDVPSGSSTLLVEPKSIRPLYYDYVINNKHRFKHIISYDRFFFRNAENLVHVPPPFGPWMHGEDVGIHEKTKNISFIASTKEMCEEHKYRQKMVKEYGHYCDVYGTGRGSKQLKNKIDGLKDYRFTFCMENYITDLYYTEKLLDCFLTGTIPIFFGTRSINTIFDADGIVWLDDITRGIIPIESLNENYYSSKLNSIIHNCQIAKSMHTCVQNSIDCFVKFL